MYSFLFKANSHLMFLKAYLVVYSQVMLPTGSYSSVPGGSDNFDVQNSNCSGDTVSTAASLLWWI